MPVRTLFAAAAIALLAAVPVQAQAPQPIRIGVLTDLSSLFTDSTGQGSIEAVKLAVETFGPTLLGRPIEVVSADHQNRPELAAEIAKKWYQQDGVEVIADLPNSSAALAVQEVSRQQKKIALQSSSGVEDLTGKACSPYGFQWAWDTYAQAKALVTALPRLQPDTWFIIVADYSFGLALERGFAQFVTAEGGKVLGATRHPINTSDLSSFLVEAQSSGARTVVLGSGGADALNSIKQAAEFGLTRGGQRIVGASTFLVEIDAVGLETAQGLILAEGFYWDRDDASRAFARRFFADRKRMPNVYHAAAYSAVLHWLHAAQAAGTLNADTIAAKMRELPVNDAFAHDGHVREDGRMVHEVILVQVKSPQESKERWDDYKILTVVPGDQVVRPLSESTCPLVHASAAKQ